MTDERRALRARVLASFGARGPVLDELLAYGEPVGVKPADLPPFPLPAEPHVVAWEGYAAQAAQIGAWEALRSRLPQLWFPVSEGISRTQAYRAATRHGARSASLSEATGLGLRSPQALRLWLHASAAGPIPVLCSADRDDFVRLVRALGHRNEPAPVSASMGACIVSGLNNPDRVRQYRERWVAHSPARASPAAWADELRKIFSHRELYQDRLLILSEGPYSNVPAGELGLAPQEWLRLSLTIRLEHECAHYLSYRLFGVMRNHALDELLADCAGITAAWGSYRPDWFLRFVGLEAFPRYRPGGRLENYRGNPPLSDEAFHVLGALVKAAAEQLARLDDRWLAERPGPWARAALMATLFPRSLEELASIDESGTPKGGPRS